MFRKASGQTDCLFRIYVFIDGKEESQLLYTQFILRRVTRVIYKVRKSANIFFYVV